jgi:hypothetical protein
MPVGVSHTRKSPKSVVSANRPSIAQGKTRRLADTRQRRKLAEMNFLWEEYERIPLRLRRRLCPARPNGKVLSP